MGLSIHALPPHALAPVAPLLHHTANTAAPKPALAPKPPPAPAIAPVAPPASAQAIMMENATHADPPAGIEFDDVPFQDDAVLSDDIIRPDPVTPPVTPPTPPQNQADCAPMLPD